MHSQNDEECHILDAFREGAGNFLDVGAYDVTTLSNTHCLAVKGWNDVCVEPSAFVFPKLVGLYQGWPDIQVVNGALDFSHLLAKSYDSNGTPLSILEGTKVHGLLWMYSEKSSAGTMILYRSISKAIASSCSRHSL